jgi:acyl carrier protein
MTINFMIENQLLNLIRDVFMGGDPQAIIIPTEDFIESGICDSLGLVRLATALEAEFPGIHIHDQEINRETIGSLALLNSFIPAKMEDV